MGAQDCIFNGRVLVWNRSARYWNPTVLANQGSQHWGVAVNDAIAGGLRPSGQYLITCRQDRNNRLPDNPDHRAADGSKEADVLGADSSSSGQRLTARLDILAAPPNIFSRWYGF